MREVAFASDCFRCCCGVVVSSIMLFLFCDLFSDAVLPCDLLQGRSWQTEGKSRRGVIKHLNAYHHYTNSLGLWNLMPASGLRVKSHFGTVWSVCHCSASCLAGTLCDWQLCPLPLKAAKIPLSSELGIDEFHFNDFSLDNDAMITASLRMFLELGVVQKFKIDYEVRLMRYISCDVRCLQSVTRTSVLL